MSDPSSEHYELSGYVLWFAGIILFAVAAARNGDTLSLVASVLFLLGIIVVMVPMVRRYRRRG